MSHAFHIDIPSGPITRKQGKVYFGKKTRMVGEWKFLGDAYVEVKWKSQKEPEALHGKHTNYSEVTVGKVYGFLEYRYKDRRATSLRYATSIGSGSGFYDDSLEGLLGGARELLGNG